MNFVANVDRNLFDIYVGRGSPFGNPFRIGLDGTRSEVISKYTTYVISNVPLLLRIKRELRGKILGCHCYPLPCHADVLAAIANNDS